MPVWWFWPTAVTAAPVVLIPDIYGATPFYAELCGRLAQQGHPTLLVDYFYQVGALSEVTREAAFARLAELDGSRAIQDLHVALDAAHREGGGGTRIGTLGFCLGGQLSLVLAAQRTDLVSACFYPFPEGVAADVAVPPPRPIDLASEISGPVLAFWGDQDYVPVETMARFADAMEHHHGGYAWRLLPGVGHGFLQGLVHDSDSSSAARECWEETLSFFRQYLEEG